VRDIAAIVEPAIDIRQLSRDIAREHIALQDTDRKVEVNAAQGESLRERQTQHRLEMGRMLIEAKKQVPHGGWLLFLKALGISARASQEWIALGDYGKYAPTETGAHLPTRREVAAARREPESVGDEPDDQDDEPDETKPDPPQAKPNPPGPETLSLDIDRELSKIRNKFCDFAAAVPAARKQIAHELHETARLIESMQ